jgi:DNA replication protein DnaC
MMERSEILTTMGELKLYGMKSAYDEIMATAIKRQHEPRAHRRRSAAAEIAEKQARSIKYQMTIAKLPLAKDIEDFDFTGTPINETLVKDLAAGNFLAHQRNVVLIGGTGTGKTHLAIAIARACHPQWRPRPLLQRRRSGQQARGRDPRRPAGTHGRLPDPQGLRRPR